MDIQLKQIWQPIAEGTDNIETWWPRNEEYVIPFVWIKIKK